MILLKPTVIDAKLVNCHFRLALSSSKSFQNKNHFSPMVINQRKSMRNALCASLATDKLILKTSTHLAIKHQSISTMENIPSLIRALFLQEKDKTNQKLYPGITQISSLIRKMNAINIDVDSFENKLQSTLNADLLTCSSTNDTITYIMEWENAKKKLRNAKKENAQKVRRDTLGKQNIDAFKKIIDYYLALENNRSNPIDLHYAGVLNYTVVCWRLVNIIEKVMHEPDTYQREISLLEKTFKEISTESKIHTMLYFYWVNLLNEGSVYCERKAKRIANKHPELFQCLLDDIRNYCDEIHNGQYELTNLPKPLDIGSLMLAPDILSLLHFLDNDKLTALLCYTSVIFWYADMPSRSFSILSKLCLSYVTDCDSHRCSNSSDPDLIVCYSAIVEDIVVEECDIGHEYINKMLNEMNSTLPLFQYIYYLQLDRRSKGDLDSRRKTDLVRKCPKIIKLKEKNLEKALFEELDIDMKRTLISSALINIHEAKDTSAPSLVTEENHAMDFKLDEPDKPLKSTVNIDDQLSEFLRKKDYVNAINMITDETHSTKLMLPLVKSILETEDTALINKLRSVLPVQTEISDVLYCKEHNLKMAAIQSIWRQNEKLEALTRTLLQYETILEEEYCITSANFEVLLKETRSVIRGFSLRLISNQDLDPKDLKYIYEISNLDALKEFGIKFSNIYLDYSILTIYWEALFFHTKKYKSKAEEILAQYPFIPRHVDVDEMLHEAMSQKTDKLFLLILRFCLRFDIDEYIKSKVIGQWIVYQCDKGNSEGLKKANELIIMAKDLNIPVSADALQNCIELENNLSGLSSLLSRITSVILKNTDSKRSR